MTRPQKPDTQAAQWADLDRRVKALEVGGRAEHTTMQGGLFRLRDVAGALRAAMGDLDLDNTTWGFEVTAGGVFRVRDADGVLRAVIGDIDDTGKFYAVVLNHGGQVQVRDADGVPRAAMGDITEPDDFVPTYGFHVLDGGAIRVAGGGAVSLFDDAFIEVFDNGLIQIIGGGAFTAGADGSGPFPVWIGELGERLVAGDGKYGVVVGDLDSAAHHFWVDNDGMHEPWLSVPWVDVDAFKVVTDGSFAPQYRAQVSLVSHKGLRASIGWSTDPGTTGELHITGPDGATDAVALADGSNDVANFAWLHGTDLGAGPATFDVEARVTGGAGEVHIFTPQDLSMSDAGGCTATGLP